MSEEKTEEQIISEYFSKLGKKGGKVSRGGGRPAIPEDERTPVQKLRHERYKKKKGRKIKD